MPTSLGQTARKATRIFRTFDEGDPDLIDIGIPAVRETIGNMFGGNIVIIAAAQNVGKTSFLRTMGMLSEARGGVLSLEDGEDVWGARLLAAEAHVKPTKIRRKDLTEEETERLREAQKTLEERDAAGLGPVLEYRIGASTEAVVEGVEALVADGCRWVAMDYLQKGRNSGNQDRRSEVGLYMSAFQGACAAGGAVPIIFSQLVRMPPTKEPYPGHLKESGDIENEARLILMLWRDPADQTLVRGKVAKSSFGGAGIRFAYRYTDWETLLPSSDDFGMEEEDEDF